MAEFGVFFEIVAVFSILIVVVQLGAGATVVKTVSECRALGRTQEISVCDSHCARASRSRRRVLAAFALFAFAPQLANELVHGWQSQRRDRLSSGRRSVCTLRLAHGGPSRDARSAWNDGADRGARQRRQASVPAGCRRGSAQSLRCLRPPSAHSGRLHLRSVSLSPRTSSVSK